MKKEATKFYIRNTLEVLVLVGCLIFFGTIPAVSIYSLLPLIFVLFVFIYDFYKIYNFSLSQDIDGLRSFQSKLLFYSFSWYFLPVFLSIYLVLKNLKIVDGEYLITTFVLYALLYLYNLKVSRELKKNQA